jgi:tripartite-type tricarboxylate transporter receptor subunit TctC
LSIALYINVLKLYTTSSPDIVISGFISPKERLFLLNKNVSTEKVSFLLKYRIKSDEKILILITSFQYKFVIDSRPGAGGTVAANAVAASPQNTIVSMSSSFIIRPLFESDLAATHNLENFTPILVQGNGSPLVFVSKKYRSFDEVLGANNINIGVSGIGSISHIAAQQIILKNNSAQIVNFKNSIEAVTAALGGHIDIAVTFISDIESFDKSMINVLAYTGNGYGIENKKLLLKNKGFTDSENLTSNFAIFASRNMDPVKFKELHEILMLANFRPAVVENYRRDFLTPVALNIDQSRNWYNNQIKFWKTLIDRIK